jgi:hypothetical protein
MKLYFNPLRVWPLSPGLLAVISTLVLTVNAFGIVDANSMANTNAPGDGSPWANVGQIGGGASGIYLGGGWVLTASHVGVGTIALAGGAYPPGGRWLQLTNSDGTTTDLIMFHLATQPPLPSIPLVGTTPSAFTQVDLVGCGLIAGSGQSSIGIYTGFYWSSVQFKSWGNNRISLGGVSSVNIGYGNLSAFSMDFTSPGTLGPNSQTSDEAQVAPGDSGGAVFAKAGSVWQLAGVIDAEGTQVNQAASTSVYGDSTYAADVATYKNQINAVLSSGPVPPLTITRSGGSSQISWPDTGINYTLQASGSLVSSSWVVLSQPRSSTNGQIVTVVADTNAFALFRLQKP